MEGSLVAGGEWRVGGEFLILDWPPKTFPRPSWSPPPAIMDDRLRGGILDV